jgi:lipopolysaccharide transport system ATP-binding protein
MRLAFAVAAHLEPDILLVDEVLAVGDAAFQKKCLGKMGDVAKEGRTVLFVSHNMGAVQRLCPLSLLLDNGKIISYGETQRVLEEYLSSAVEKRFENHSLESLPRLSGLGENIRFTRCSILNSQGKTRNHILFGESFSICLEATAREELRDLSIVIGIDSFMEDRITSVASEDSDILFSASPDQPLRVRAHFNTLALKPGIYLITLGIRLRVKGLDHLPYVVKLEVTEIHEKDSKQYSVSLGPIHTVADWDHFI